MSPSYSDFIVAYAGVAYIRTDVCREAAQKTLHGFCISRPYQMCVQTSFTSVMCAKSFLQNFIFTEKSLQTYAPFNLPDANTFHKHPLCSLTQKTKQSLRESVHSDPCCRRRSYIYIHVCTRVFTYINVITQLYLDSSFYGVMGMRHVFKEQKAPSWSFVHNVSVNMDVSVSRT